MIVVNLWQQNLNHSVRFSPSYLLSLPPKILTHIDFVFHFILQKIIEACSVQGLNVLYIMRNYSMTRMYTCISNVLKCDEQKQ